MVYSLLKILKINKNECPFIIIYCIYIYVFMYTFVCICVYIYGYGYIYISIHFYKVFIIIPHYVAITNSC